MIENRSRFYLSVFLCFVVHLILASPLHAQSNPEVVVFKKIGLLDPEDRTRQRYAENIGKQIRRELASAFRFEIVPQPKLSKELPLSAPDLIALGKRFELDGIITGSVEVKDNGLKIDLTLLEAKTGDPFAREVINVKDFKNPDAVEREIRALVGKLISRIPYQAVVTDVRDKGKTITINAGQLHGLGNGMRLQIFRIAKVNRHRFTQEVIGIEKVIVGELIVVNADEQISIAKPLRLEKDQVVARGQYAVFKPSVKVISEMAPRRNELLAQQEREWTALEEAALKEKKEKEEKKEKQIPVWKASRGNLALYAGTAWSNFTLKSDQLDFDRKISTFPLVSISGEYWVIPSIGFDADYQAGFAKLERLSGSTISVRARPYWYASYLKYRYILRPGTTNLELIGRVGYAWYVYRVSKTDSQFLTDTRYQGPGLGFEGRLTLTPKTSASLGVDYQPSLRVSERQATSGGNASSWSIGFHVEGRYRLRSGLWMSIRYLFSDVIASYSGTGSRAGGVTGSKTRDELNGVMFGLVTEF